MRKLVLFVLMLAIVLTGSAFAAGATDALGLSGAQAVATMSDNAMRAGENLFVVMADGDKESLVRIPREGGESVLVETADEISELVAIDDVIYYIRQNGAEKSLMRRLPNGTRSAMYTFTAGKEAGKLSAFDGNLYVLIDGQMHIIYAESGMVLKLFGEKMTEYVIVGDLVYYVSADDLKTYETDSLLGEGKLTGSAGCVYAFDLRTATSSKVLDTGVSDLKYFGGRLFFHNLADNYVMGTGDNEWMEGKLYTFDINTKASTRLVDGYDWGFFPMENGYVVYTSGALTYTSNNGVVRTLYAPEVYATVSGGGDLIIVYEPTTNKVTYAFPDGTTAAASEGETGYEKPQPVENQGDGLQNALNSLTGEELDDLNKNGGQNKTNSETGTGKSDSSKSSNSPWFDNSKKEPSGGSSSSSGKGSSGNKFTEKDS